MSSATAIDCIELRDPRQPDATPNNVYRVGGDLGLLIDAGYVSASNRAVVQALFDRRAFDRILLTHAHRDHAEAAPEYQALFDLELYAHPDERLPETRGPVYDLAEGQSFVLSDGARLTVLHTPGHTSGHCVFWLEPQRALFSGDLVLGRGRCWVGPPRGQMTAYLASLERIASLGATTIYPGHGPLVDDPAARIADEIRFRLERESQILALLGERRRSAAELVRALYPALSLSRLPMVALNLQGHLERLLDLAAIELDPGSGRYRVRRR